MLHLLTVVTTAVLPAQFMSGLYGMNFERNFPELGWAYGYPAWWAVIVTSVSCVLYWFHKNAA